MPKKRLMVCRCGAVHELPAGDGLVDWPRFRFDLEHSGPGHELLWDPSELLEEIA